jgi:hypothetical protein
MFGESKNQTIRENAVSASAVALQLAQNRKFRKRLLSALKHTSEASRRTRRGFGLTGTITRLASDQALQSELRSARSDLRRAYQELDAKRRRSRIRRFALLAALASLAAAPRLRERVTNMISTATGRRRQPADIADRVPQTDSSSDGSSRPGSLENLTREELYARAQEKEIPGRSEMSKQELVDALRARA